MESKQTKATLFSRPKQIRFRVIPEHFPLERRRCIRARQVRHLRFREGKTKTPPIRLTVSTLIKRPSFVDILVVFSVHKRAIVRVVICKTNSTGDGDGNPEANTISKEVPFVIHSVRSEEPIETQRAERDIQLFPFSIPRGHNSPLIVSHVRTNHQLERFDPKLSHSLAGSNEGSGTHDVTRSSLSVSHRKIDTTLIEQVEDLVGGCSVTRIHLSIDNETDVEGWIRIVECTRAPLLAAVSVLVFLIDLVENIDCIEEFLRGLEIGYNGYFGLIGDSREQNTQRD